MTQNKNSLLSYFQPFFIKRRMTVLVFSMGLCLLSTLAWANNMSWAQSLQVSSDAKGVYVDAQMALVLSDDMREALDVGVSLYFLAEVQVKRGRWYWFDATDALRTREVKLSYLPLVRQYRVTVGGLSQQFSSLDEASKVVGSITSWRIADASILAVSGVKTLLFSFELNHKKLPRLFQLGIAQDKAWQLHIMQEVSLPKG